MAVAVPVAEEVQLWATEAETLARKAGALFLAARVRGGFGMTSKGGVDLVTEVDEAAEKLILDGLGKAFPTHDLVGEETSGLGGEAEGPFPFSGDGNPVWIVDPLDGTTNFVTGQNDVVVSIACWASGAPVVGVIFNPFLDECYTATAGGGAFCNGKAIRVNPESDLSKVVVMNNVGACRDPVFVSASTHRLEKILLAGVRGLRLGGSCAMNMCYVASARMGVYFERGFGGPWDVAAGILIVREAGGVVCTLANSPLELRAGKGEVLCGNAAVCTAISAIVEGP
mmetsp:Transcript_28152/g.73797  ORF Transcript_28152/g.73797 Transcript_28152/m.73797 type:complete len:284 (-) Transcript_28152:472-1323(-)